MTFIRQTYALIRMYLADLRRRPGRTFVAGLGVATTVAVMISLLAVGAGAREMAGGSHAPDRVVVLPANSASDNVGVLPITVGGVVSEAPGVKRDAAGVPLVQPVTAVVIDVVKKAGGVATARIRATGSQGRKMNEQVRIIEGRDIRPGTYELLVGDVAHKEFENLAVGDHLTLRGARWTVVGVFSDNGGVNEGGLLADVDSILSGFDRGAYQMVEVQLDTPRAFAAFKEAIEADPRIPLKARRQSEYVTSRIAPFMRMVNLVGLLVGSVMALGATAGTLTAMYGNVDSRTRETATLRALGYGGGAVMTAIIIESLAISVPAALIGAGVAALLFNGDSVTTLGLSFPLAVDAGLVMTGVIFSIIIGLVGGVAPAIRAVRTPVAESLRAV